MMLLLTTMPARVMIPTPVITMLNGRPVASKPNITPIVDKITALRMRTA